MKTLPQQVTATRFAGFHGGQAAMLAASLLTFCLKSSDSRRIPSSLKLEHLGRRAFSHQLFRRRSWNLRILCNQDELQGSQELKWSCAGLRWVRVGGEGSWPLTGHLTCFLSEEGKETLLKQEVTEALVVLPTLLPFPGARPSIFPPPSILKPKHIPTQVRAQQ